MSEWRLGAIEARFADIIWEHEPITSSELARLAELQLSWKRTTMYTVLKRLCDRGLFQNIQGTVSSCMSREVFYALQSEEYVRESFGGSLPAFLVAFSSRNGLSTDEIQQLEDLIHLYRSGTP